MSGFGPVVIIDDDPDFRLAVVQSLELSDLEVRSHALAEPALCSLDAAFEGIVVSDIRMPGMDGHQLHDRLRALDPDIPMIMITGHGDVAEAVDALRNGVYDFITKPFSTEHLVSTVRRALEKRRLVLENRRLAALAASDDDMGIIGEALPIRALRARIRHLAAADVDVLIEGEAGVGKELIARALHRQSGRRRQPFVMVDCTMLEHAHAELDLFGHEMGAFPGAIRRRVGRIESADKGSLFLRGVESLPLHLQGRLLRVLEEQEVFPLGADRPRPVSIKVIASCRPGPADRPETDGLRPELYYRLEVGRIVVAPLRDRVQDAPALFAHFLREACVRLHTPAPDIDTRIHHRLLSDAWPGNVREIRYFAERVALGVDVPSEDAASSGHGLATRVNAYERLLLCDALTRSGGDARTAVEMLQLPRKTFYEKLRRHGLDIAAFRGGRGLVRPNGLRP